MFCVCVCLFSLSLQKHLAVVGKKTTSMFKKKVIKNLRLYIYIYIYVCACTETSACNTNTAKDNVGKRNDLISVQIRWQREPLVKDTTKTSKRTTTKELNLSSNTQEDVRSRILQKNKIAIVTKYCQVKRFQQDENKCHQPHSSPCHDDLIVQSRRRDWRHASPFCEVGYPIHARALIIIPLYLTGGLKSRLHCAGTLA